MAKRKATKKATKNVTKKRTRRASPAPTRLNFYTRLYDVLDNNKLLIGIPTAVVLSLGSLAVGYSSKEVPLYSEVMDDGKKVSYTERSSGESEMRVISGRDSVKYFDLEGATAINWGAKEEPAYSRDKLERIEAKIDGKNYVFDLDDVDGNTEKGKRAKGMFEKSNADFNARRKSIRGQLRDEFAEDTSSLRSFFE
jgi:hypothetical protein